MEHPKIKHVLSRALQLSEKARVLAGKYGYRPFMVQRYLEILGEEETLRLLDANEKPLPVTLRCNSHLIDCKDLKERLERKGFRLEPLREFSPHGFIVRRAPYPAGATHEYLQGYYYLQGPVSMSIVHAMDLDVDGPLLDMAAAPGGKATQILQLTGDSRLLVAVEKSRRRIKALRSNLQRMRFKNYIIYRLDSRRLPFNNAFASVLLDAPSTGEGIIRKDPRRKTSRSPEDLLEIHRLQVEMLHRALDYVRPGGSVLYATCSLGPEEGELVIDTILRLRGDVTIDPISLPASEPPTEYFGVKLDSRVSLCRRFWPHRQGYEGFFACKVRRVGRQTHA